jgi:two-component system, cell cycle sensor histidine kinase and response regulator CckA
VNGAAAEAVDWLDQIPAPAAVLCRDGRVLQWNAEASDLFDGFVNPFVPGGPDARWFRRVLDGVAATGTAVTVASRRQAGRRITVELRCRGLDEERMLVLFRDCTAQVAARKVRRSGEHHLRSFLDRLPEPVLIEQNGRIAYGNPAAAQLVGGAAADQLAGRDTAAVLPPEILERLRTADRAVSPGELETTVRLGGADRVVQAAALPLRYQRAPALAVFLRDVTGQRTAEHGLAASNESLRRSEEQLRQAQKLEAVGRLAAGVAHDFNNLLTAIQGHVQFVLEDLPPDLPVRSDVVEIGKAADRATDLTRQLLTFARRQPNRVEALDLNAVVKDVERLLRRVVRADIALDMVLDADVPRALVDRGQFEQVLVNLAVNARDAMTDGGTISVRTATILFDDVDSARSLELKPGRYVQLTISDTGCGMSEDVQSRIFEPFFTTKAEGTGLGLPTVYGIVKQSGGHISVYSEESVGTTIKIFLPVAHDRDAAEADRGGDAAPARMDAGSGNGTAAARAGRADGAPIVLLVEDDAGIRALAERTLRADGLDVVAAASGEEALQLAGSLSEIDVVVTDMMMPNMNGEDLAERISRSHPEAALVLMSGFSEERLLQEGRIEQRQHFLEKPFSQRHLLRTVRDALRH